MPQYADGVRVRGQRAGVDPPPNRLHVGQEQLDGVAAGTGVDLCRRQLSSCEMLVHLRGRADVALGQDVGCSLCVTSAVVAGDLVLLTGLVDLTIKAFILPENFMND